jgi:hypothetical protein
MPKAQNILVKKSHVCNILEDIVQRVLEIPVIHYLNDTKSRYSLRNFFCKDND